MNPAWGAFLCDSLQACRLANLVLGYYLGVDTRRQTKRWTNPTDYSIKAGGLNIMKVTKRHSRDVFAGYNASHALISCTKQASTVH
jgi:hypothetical protein